MLSLKRTVCAFGVLALITIAPLAADIIVEHPGVDLSELYRGVKDGGEYRRQFEFRFTALTNDEPEEVVERIKEAQRKRALSPTNTGAFYDSYGDLFVYTPDARQRLVGFGRAVTVETETDVADGGITFGSDSADRPVRLTIRGTLDTQISWGMAKRFLENDGSGIGFRWDDDTMFTGIRRNFYLGQRFNVNLVGSIARQLTVTIDHVAGRDENQYEVSWKPDTLNETAQKRSLVRNVNFGNVDLAIGGRSEFVSGGINRQATGLRADIEKIGLARSDDVLSANLIISFSKGIPREVSFVGNGTVGAQTNFDIGFVRNRFYDLGMQFVPGFQKIERYEIYEEITSTTSTEIPAFILSNAQSGNVRRFRALQSANVSVDSKGIVDMGWSRSDSATILIGFTAVVNNVSVDPPSANVSGNGRTYYYDAASALPSYYSNYTTTLESVILNNTTTYSRFIALNDRDGAGVSPWELRNRYSVPTGIDETSLEIKLWEYANGNALNIGGRTVTARIGSFEQVGEFEIDLDKGILFFKTNEPFNNGALTNALVYSKLGAQFDFSKDYRYFLETSYLRVAQTYDLDFNIIEGSEVVKRNNIVVPSSAYTIDYMSGTLTFNDPTFVGKSDHIVISYEYMPYGSALQSTLFGGRLNYRFKEGNELGMTVLHSGASKETSAPAPDAAPQSATVGDIDAILDIPKLFGWQNSPFSLTGAGEFALSFHDLNNMNKGLMLDIEGDDSSLDFPDYESARMYFTYNPQLEGEGKRLGKLYHKDFREYNAILGASWLLLTYENQALIESQGKARPFENRPGPYYHGREGSLDPEIYRTQRSWVFDYEFDALNDAKYVSVINAFNPSGIDASLYTELEIVAKLVGQTSDAIDPGKVQILIELGANNEDLDGDGVYDFEDSGMGQYDTNGMQFAYSRGGVERRTRQGLGIAKDGSDSHNSRLDTEDINEDGVWSVEDDMVGFPSDKTIDSNIYDTTSLKLYFPSYKEFTANRGAYTAANLFYEVSEMTAYASSADSMQREPYMRLRMPLNRAMDAATLSRLAKSKGMRVSIIHADGTPETGRLVVDSIRLKTTKWEDIYVDGILATNNNALLTSILNSRRDAEYQYGSGNRLIDDSEWSRIYSELHGSLSATEREELSENALKLTYNLDGIPFTGGANDNGQYAESVVFNGANRKYDLSIYKELTFFVYRDSWSGDSGGAGNEELVFSLGEATNKRYKIRIPVAFLNREQNFTEWDSRAKNNNNKWNKVTVFLMERGGNGDPSNPFRIEINGKEAFPEGDRAITVERIGNITLTAITMFSFGALTRENERASGVLWVNDVYVDEDELLISYAWRANGAFNLNRPIRIGAFPVISTFDFNYAHSEKRSGFAGVGQAVDKGNSSSDTFAAAMKFLRVFDTALDISYSDSLSDTNENSLPLDNQFYTRARSHSFRIAIDHGLSFLPRLSHAYTESLTKNFTAAQVDTPSWGDANETYFTLNKNENQSRTFGFNEEYAFSNIFGRRDVSVTQRYTLSASIQKQVKQETDVVGANEVSFARDPNNGYSVIMSNFYDDENAFNEAMRTSDIDKMGDLVKEAKFVFNRSQSGGITIGVPFVSLSGSVGHTLYHYTDYTNELAPFLNETFERNYFETYPLLFKNNEYGEKIRYEITNLIDYTVTTNNGVVTTNVIDYTVDTAYRQATLRSGESYTSDQRLTIKKMMPILDDINFTISESYGESGYLYDRTRSFAKASNRFIDGVDAFMSNYTEHNYGAPIDTKSVSVSMNGGLSLSLSFRDVWKKSPIASIPVTYNRSIGATENNVPLEPFVYNGESTSFTLGRYAAAVFPRYFAAPWYYMDFPFQPLFRWLFGLFGYEESHTKNNRHNASRMVSELLSYQNLREDVYTKAFAHDDYSSSATLNESYTIRFNLLEIPALNTIIPSSFSYTASVYTARAPGDNVISQNDTFSLNTGQTINLRRLYGYFSTNNDPANFWNTTTMSYTVGFARSNNYNAKTRSDTITVSARSTFRLTQTLTLSANVSYRRENKKQYLRYDEGYPYMGIGAYGFDENEAFIENPDTTYRRFNVGLYESFVLDASDQNIASPLLSSMANVFSADFSVNIPDTFTGIFFWKLRNPFDYIHTLKLSLTDLKWTDYDDTIKYRWTGTGELQTSLDYFAETLLRSDISDKFFTVGFEYSTAFNIQENITLTFGCKIPFVVYRYYGYAGSIEEALLSYRKLQRFDVRVGLELKLSALVRF